MSAFILGIIFWSWRTDLTQARQRLANQQLNYLAGQIRYVMEVQADQLEQWPPLLSGPGNQPSALEQLNPASFSQVLPEYVYLPEDPWQGAWSLQLAADGTWWLLGLGPSGTWPSQPDEAEYAYLIFPPQ